MIAHQIASTRKSALFRVVITLLMAQIAVGCARKPGGEGGTSNSCGPEATSHTTTSGVLDGVKINKTAALSDGAVSFTVDKEIKITEVYVGLARVGSPSGTLTVTIETDNANSPSGTVAVSGSRFFSSTLHNIDYVDTSPDFFKLGLSATYKLNASQKYWIHVSRSGAVSGTDYLIWAGATSLSQFSGVLQLNKTFSTWSAPAGTGDLMAKFTCDTSS